MFDRMSKIHRYGHVNYLKVIKYEETERSARANIGKTVAFSYLNKSW